MSKLKQIHKPSDLPTALHLLNRPDVPTVALAGGIHLVPQLPKHVQELVDLQDLALDQMTGDEHTITVGAMTRLQTLVEHPDLPQVIREGARRSGPNTFRNQGTVGGVLVGAAADSELLAALLVYEAQVTVQRLEGEQRLALADFLAGVPEHLTGGLLTAVHFARHGAGAAARVARTPADTPIVAVVGRQLADGELRLAACGVADTPLIIDPDHVTSLQPPSDFRGSSEYRLHLVQVLCRRVQRQLSMTQGG